eukprot:CAMPEP_0178685570 /NCGR_PEP_ID=MMETSP0699-20121125/3456_1 /TAXON_ID=265572 /ORGANISM="Extubocellulus spinifer, Strain CCMP396" /LENGTH=387 /DNA_ID=CAMNT_0020330337 /DNA_START=100 /DNA_END=1263 /DNA_ORIENTATION=+
MSTSGSRGSRRPFQDDVEDTALGCGEEQRKKPRLEGEQADDPHTSSNIGLDLARQVASFMNVEGSGLYNFCVAFGPEGAAEIRRDYLLDNEAYIEHNLEIVTNSVLTTRDAMLLMPQEDLSEGLAAVDKCKRNTMTWMEVNGNWKERVTAERMELYKRYTIAHERHAGTHDADAVFNNIAVAVEIGLLDVVRHLIEEKKVDVNSIKYVGFHKGVVGVRHLVGRALIRGDATMIHYLMSQDGCELRNPTTDEEKDKKFGPFARYAATQSFVEPECFKLFLELANVDLNVIYTHPSPPFLTICLGRFEFKQRSTPVSTLAREAQKIGILVEMGADPFREYFDIRTRRAYTPFQLVKDRLKEFKENGRYPQSWPLWEQLIEKMEATRVSE